MQKFLPCLGQETERYRSGPGQSSFMSLLVLREKGQDIDNHGYRRNVEGHVVVHGVIKLDEILQTALMC